MLKYYNFDITFREIPDEITLCINITNCPYLCEGCHSEHLRQDIGEVLTPLVIYDLLKINPGVSCVCFMGGDRDPKYIEDLAIFTKSLFNVKIGWYSGKDKIDENIAPIYFDYIKIGSYQKDRGALDNPNTNQQLFKVNKVGELEDITYKFWKNENKN